MSVPLEIGHDEVGGTVDPELHIATDVVELFARLGLPQPDPVALLRIEHQVAQKLHACTDFHGPAKTNDRAHDLVDLQLLESVATFDMISLRMICHRLFIARKRHEWPPIVREMPGWESIYESAARGLPVLPNIGEAVRWANTLVAAINNGEDRSGRGLA